MTTGITKSGHSVVAPEVVTLQTETDAAVAALQTATGVAGVNGSTVPAGGALTTGNVLQVTGAAALGYAPVNLAGGANFVSGVLPGANIVASKAHTLAFGDLSGLAGGAKTFDVNVGTALPANARVLCAIASSVTDFDDNGGGGTATLIVGSSAGGNEVGTSLNVALGQSGFPKAFTAGAQGYLLASQSSAQLSLRITSNHDLNLFTAGSVVVTVYYIVLA